MSAAGTQSHPYRQLAAASPSLGQQEIRKIHEGDEQNQENRCGEYQQGGAQVASDAAL